MRFALTGEQDELRAAVAELLADRCPAATIRAGAASGAARAVRDGLADLGATGLLVPEADGGLGLDENYLVPIAIELGYAAPPLPAVETLAVAPVVLAGTDRLAALVAGELFASVDPSGAGRIRFASGAHVAVFGGFGGTGSIRVVDLGGADRTPLAAVDPAADLAVAAGGTGIAEIDDPAVVLLAWRRGVLGAAAQLVGLARRMMDMTVGYVTERRQFGVPIGSFQAVKHHLASALMAVEFAAPTVAAAGAMMAAGNDDAGLARQLATAKALASDAAMTVSRATLQCHGAIGYTTEYDWQLYAKRAWATARAWGSADYHRRTVAASLGLAAS